MRQKFVEDAIILVSFVLVLILAISIVLFGRDSVQAIVILYMGIFSCSLGIVIKLYFLYQDRNNEDNTNGR